MSLSLPGDEGENIKEGNPLGSGYRAMKILKKGTHWGEVKKGTHWGEVKKGTHWGEVKKGTHWGEVKKGTHWGMVTGL